MKQLFCFKETIEVENIDEKIVIDSYFLMIYNIEKLSALLDKTLSSQLGILIVDLLQTIYKKNRENIKLSENSREIGDICEKYTFLIENAEENLSLLFKETLEKFF